MNKLKYNSGWVLFYCSIGLVFLLAGIITLLILYYTLERNIESSIGLSVGFFFSGVFAIILVSICIHKIPEYLFPRFYYKYNSLNKEERFKRVVQKRARLPGSRTGRGCGGADCLACRRTAIPLCVSCRTGAGVAGVEGRRRQRDQSAGQGDDRALAH